MAEKKKQGKMMRKPKPRSNVSPSRRQEGGSIRSREASARMGSEGSVGLRRRVTRRSIPTNPRVVEAGVGNLPMTIFRGGRAIASRIGGAGAARATARSNAASSARNTAAARAAKTGRPAGSSTTGVSKVSGGVLKGGKPTKYGPPKKKLTPQQKAAQTRLMNKARAKYAAEGPKRSTAAKPSSTKAFSKKAKVGIGAAGVGLSAASIAASRRGAEGPKKNLKGAKYRRK
jgi:hypothetical protein